MPVVPDDAVQAAMAAHAEIVAGTETLSGEEAVRRLLEAAAPVLAEAVAQKITGHMESFGPREPSGALEPVSDTGRQYRAWRRHFGIAARVAAGAFSTREDHLREAAQAIAAGNYMACDLREDDDHA